jgi:flagellar biosynthesis protein FlhG
MGLYQISRQYDLLLMDTGSGLTDNVLFFNSAADEVLLVTTPEPTALTDAYATIKVLMTERDVRNISVLVNQVASESQGLDIYRKLNGVCERFLARKIGNAGSLPKDNALVESIREQNPPVLGRPGSMFSQGVFRLAERFDQIFKAPHGTDREELWARMISGR